MSASEGLAVERDEVAVAFVDPYRHMATDLRPILNRAFASSPLLVRSDPLQPPVFLFKLPQRLHLTRGGVLLLIEVRRRADPGLPADLLDWRAVLTLPDDDAFWASVYFDAFIVSRPLPSLGNHRKLLASKVAFRRNRSRRE
jgi:hypothetical protein